MTPTNAMFDSTLYVWFDFGNHFGTEARACRLRTATEVVEATKAPYDLALNGPRKLLLNVLSIEVLLSQTVDFQIFPN